MQHNPGARSAHRMPDGDGAPIYVQALFIELAHGCTAQVFLAPFFILPRGDACQYLGGERFVDFPEIGGIEIHAVAFEYRGCRMNRAQAHNGWIQCCPLHVHDTAQWPQAPAFNGTFRCQNQHRGTIGYLRAIAGGDIAPRAIKNRLQG